MVRHNHGYVRSTKPYLPWKLVYSEKFESRSESMIRENYLKSMKSKDFILKLVEASRYYRDVLGRVPMGIGASGTKPSHFEEVFLFKLFPN